VNADFYRGTSQVWLQSLLHQKLAESRYRRNSIAVSARKDRQPDPGQSELRIATCPIKWSAILKLSCCVPIALVFAGEWDGHVLAETVNWVGGIGGSWQSASNWNPAHVPTGADTVILQGTERAILNGNTAPIDYLQVITGASIYTGSFTITVDSVFAVITGVGALVRVDTGGALNSNELVLMQGGLLQLNGGSAFTSNKMNIAQLAGSPIKGVATGRGTITVGAWLNNMGRIEASGGTLQIGRTSISTRMDLDGDDEAQFPGELIARSNATLFLTAPVSDDFDGALLVELNGTARFNASFGLGTSGSAEVNGRLEINDPVAETWTISGRLHLGTSGHVGGNVFPIVVDNGIVSGRGTFETGLIVDTGTLSIGDEQGTGVITGSDILLAPNSTVVVDVGTSNDRLAVSGQLIVGEPHQVNNEVVVTPGGTLHVDFTEGYAPTAGDSFDVLDFGQFLGGFTDFELPSLGSGLSWDVDSLSINGSIAIELLGDYNVNGIIDAADYVIWRKSVNQHGVDLPADGNHDRVVDTADYSIWRSRFGSRTVSGMNTSAIPELKTVNLFTACLLIIVICGFRTFR
jgi:hypothetical protein